jgi:heterodisulfide reductase subunit A
MDMRAFSKGYEAYYQRAKQQYGIEYTRCRISGLREDPETHDLFVRHASTLVGAKHASPLPLAEETFDLVVLSVGMQMSDSVKKLAHKLGVELDAYGFCHTTLFDPLQTSRPGIYAVGPFREPKDIPETVVEASGAAGQVAGLLSTARHTLTRVVEYPAERDVTGEEPRVGVFVCHCGRNIGGYLDVPSVAEAAARLPGVVHAEHNLYTCSQDSIAHITDQIGKLGLNRVVVASCTPRTHAPLFQDSLRAAGLNPALFEMANIRNQCSWVHSEDRAIATRKAHTLVRMAAARASTLEPLTTVAVPIEHGALVVGGGVAGMTSALTLAEAGYPVDLVEREPELGGTLRKVHGPIDGESPKALLDDLNRRVGEHPKIRVHLGSQLVETKGFVGNFETTLRQASGSTIPVRHGVTIVATGGEEYRPKEYGYRDRPRMVTGLEMEALLAKARGESVELDGRAAEAWRALGARLPDSMTMILCIGPAENYCGRICCTTALKNALALKTLNPAARITVLFRDLRTYGFKERMYSEARRQGIVFLRYDAEHPPQIEVDGGERLSVVVHDPSLDLPLRLPSDLVMLSVPAVPSHGSRQLATALKVPVDADGFFLEAHVKLRPVDFASEGLFMAGMAHYPKLVDETIVQARAAGARAARVLDKPSLTAGGAVAEVDASLCVGCLTCVRVCPFDIPKVRSDLLGAGGVAGAAFIEPTVCQGCGSCVAECPAKAISLGHFRDDQLLVKLEAMMTEVAVPHE